MTRYSEHEKLKVVEDQTQAIGEFLDWCHDEKGLVLCRQQGGRYWPIGGFVKLLAEWAGIDPDLLEAEKRHMLDEMDRIRGGDHDRRS